MIFAVVYNVFALCNGCWAGGLRLVQFLQVSMIPSCCSCRFCFGFNFHDLLSLLIDAEQVVEGSAFLPCWVVSGVSNLVVIATLLLSSWNSSSLFLCYWLCIVPLSLCGFHLSFLCVVPESVMVVGARRYALWRHWYFFFPCNQIQMYVKYLVCSSNYCNFLDRDWARKWIKLDLLWLGFYDVVKLKKLQNSLVFFTAYCC